MFKTFILLNKKEYLIIFYINLNFNDLYSFIITLRYSLTFFFNRVKAYYNIIKSLKALNLALNII